jgi:hypothetical protein
MRARHIRQGVFHGLFVLSLMLPGGASLSAEGGRVIIFPAPPHPEAIGTRVGAIDTYVSAVTLSPPASVHRLGLVYSEIRGTITGVGWGGQPVTLRCHYAYELSYVLRIPPAWSGGLVVFRHGSAPLELWQDLEAALGERNLGRIFHEQADRFVSDVALDPRRRWAFFAVNQTGVAPGGAHNTRLVGEPGCPEGTPTQSPLDVSIARDHALLAQYLLKVLRGRPPTMTLGTGHSAGPIANFLLNAGIDHRRPGGLIHAGDNHRTPYDPSSGRIFDAFLSIQSGFAGALPPADQLGGLSVPTIFMAGEADRGLAGPVNIINQMLLNGAIDVPGMTRLYTVRSMPHIDADLVLGLKREGTDFTDPAIPQHFTGAGERLKPVMAALLDALARWGTLGVPPPPSMFNGEVKTMPDRIEFHRTSDPATSFPYVDDEVLDTYTQPPPVVPSAALRAAWTNVRTALGGTIGSIVLPENACRRGAFHFFGMGPIGTHFAPFDEATFLGVWGSPAVHQTCRVQTVDALETAGFYDATVVTIDVEPDRLPNVIDLQAGRLTVAVFGTAGFDATAIVPGSLRLASARAHGIAPNPGDVRARVADVNHDGRPDLLLEFRLDRLALDPTDIVVDLWGLTRGGGTFAGSDLVQIAADQVRK